MCLLHTISDPIDHKIMRETERQQGKREIENKRGKERQKNLKGKLVSYVISMTYLYILKIQKVYKL